MDQMDSAGGSLAPLVHLAMMHGFVESECPAAAAVLAVAMVVIERCCYCRAFAVLILLALLCGSSSSSLVGSCGARGCVSSILWRSCGPIPPAAAVFRGRGT